MVEWSPGTIPTAYFRDHSGNTINSVKIPNYNHEEMLKWFEEHNFKPLTLIEPSSTPEPPTSPPTSVALLPVPQQDSIQHEDRRGTNAPEAEVRVPNLLDTENHVFLPVATPLPEVETLPTSGEPTTGDWHLQVLIPSLCFFIFVAWLLCRRGFFSTSRKGVSFSAAVAAAVPPARKTPKRTSLGPPTVV